MNVNCLHMIKEFWHTQRYLIIAPVMGSITFQINQLNKNYFRFFLNYLFFPSLDVSKLEVVYNQQTASPRGKVFFDVIKYLLTDYSDNTYSFLLR